MRLCVCVCLSVLCMCERKRKREYLNAFMLSVCVWCVQGMCVYSVSVVCAVCLNMCFVCVCVCVREREGGFTK